MMSIQHSPMNNNFSSPLSTLENALKKLSYALRTSISITDENYGVLIRPTKLTYYKLINGEMVPVPARLIDYEIRMDLLMDLGRELLNIARAKSISYSN